MCIYVCTMKITTYMVIYIIYIIGHIISTVVQLVTRPRSNVCYNIFSVILKIYQPEDAWSSVTGRATSALLHCVIRKESGTERGRWKEKDRLRLRETRSRAIAPLWRFTS